MIEKDFLTEMQEKEENELVPAEKFSGEITSYETGVIYLVVLICLAVILYLGWNLLQTDHENLYNVAG